MPELVALVPLMALLVWREIVANRRIADLERQLTRALSAQSGVPLDPQPKARRERPAELTDPYLVP